MMRRMYTNISKIAVACLLAVTSLSFVNPVQAAGQDLNFSCTLTQCTRVAPVSGPLFNEPNLSPGKSVTRKVLVKNSTTQQGILQLRGFNLRESSQSASLAEKMVVVVRRNNANTGPVVYGSTPKTLQTLITDGAIVLGNFTPNQTDSFYISTAFKDDADNQYQSLTSVFDFDIGFTFIPNSPANLISNGNGNGNSNGDSGGGTSTSTCADSRPRTSTVLTFTESSTSDGKVSLHWVAVSGANNYALNFGLQPGVYIYGNNNIGNQTDYTVTELTPGIKYYFQIIPLNGCATGPRSNVIATDGTQLGLGATTKRPTGFSPEQVLGLEVEASSEASPSGQSGQVLGDQTPCTSWKQFLPLIFLLIQIVVSVAIYLVVRDPENKLKQLVVIVTIIVTSLLFYFLRDCNCGQWSILALLCKWYLVVAILIGFIVQFINYALIEREPSVEKLK